MSYQLCLSCGVYCDPLRWTCPVCGSDQLMSEEEYNEATDYENYLQSIQGDLAYEPTEDEDE